MKENYVIKLIIIIQETIKIVYSYLEDGVNYRILIQYRDNIIDEIKLILIVQDKTIITYITYH